MTQAGKAFEAHARLIQRNITLAMAEMKRLGGVDEGMIRVGISPMMADRVMPKAIASFCSLHDAIEFNVRVDVNVQLLRSLRKGELDLVFCGMPDRNLFENLKYRVLAEGQLGVIARKGHRLTRKGPVLQDVVDERWVLHGREVISRRWLDQMLAEHFIEPKILLESNSLNHLLGVVADSDCISFVPWLALNNTDASTSIERLKIRELTWTHEIGAIFREEILLPATWSTLISQVKNAIHEFPFI